MKKLLLFFFLATALAFSFSPIVQAADEEAMQFDPQVPIPVGGSGFDTGDNVDVGSYYTSSTGDRYFKADLLPKYINTFYKYFQGIVGILAVIILMIGGVVWLTSAGDSTRIGQAKKMIGGAITGIIILFSSWIILNTVNPDLVNLPTIDIPTIKAYELGCCETADDAMMINKEDCDKKEAASFYESTDTEAYVVQNLKCIKQTISCYILLNCQDEVVECRDSLTLNDIKNIQNCNGIQKDLAMVVSTACSSVPECGGKTGSCKGVRDGKRCPDSDLDSAYCYDGFCMVGTGEAGERCGNDPGATCYSKYCSQIDGNYEIDNMGGRICATGLNCCYEAD